MVSELKYWLLKCFSKLIHIKGIRKFRMFFQSWLVLKFITLSPFFPIMQILPLWVPRLHLPDIKELKETARDWHGATWEQTQILYLSSLLSFLPPSTLSYHQTQNTVQLSQKWKGTIHSLNKIIWWKPYYLIWNTECH